MPNEMMHYSNECVITKTYFNNNKNKNMFLESRLFNLFFLFNYSFFNKQFRPHANYDFFYFKKLNNTIILINTKKFIER